MEPCSPSSPPPPSASTIFFARIMLTISTVCGSCMMPMFKRLSAVSPYIRNAWRALLITICFIPFVVYEYRKDAARVRGMITWKTTATVFICQFFGTITSLLQIAALAFTFSSHVLLFSGLISIVLLMWKVLRRMPITRMEIAGIAVAILGSYILTQEGDVKGGYSKRSIVFGDFLSLLASITGAISLQMTAPLMQVFTEGMYASYANLICFLISILCLYVMGGKLTYDLDPVYGILGCFSGSNFLLCVGGLGVMTSYGVAWTFMISIKYLSPLLISLTYLVQPMLAQLISTAAGLEAFPGASTVVGGAVVLVGLFLVAREEELERARREEQEVKIDAGGELVEKLSS